MTLRWGFLGAGNISRTALAPAVHAADGAVLQAVAARDPERAAALEPRGRSYGDYQQLVDDPDVDAVYIGLANDAHLPWTLAALRAGKPVLCEKPLGLTATEVDEMTAVSAQTGQPVVEASWYRWHPRIRLAQQHLADIGPVTHVAAGFTFAGELAGNYRLDPALGGGALYDVGCYAVSACLWAVGQGLPDAVTAQSSTDSSYGGSGVDLDSRALLDWPSGASAEVHAAMNRADGQWLVITGERGELELRGQPFTTATAASELWVSDGQGTERIEVAATDTFRVMVEEVSSVFSGGPGWVLPLAESRLTASVLDAALASGRAGGEPVRPRQEH